MRAGWQPRAPGHSACDAGPGSSVARSRAPSETQPRWAGICSVQPERRGREDECKSPRLEVALWPRPEGARSRRDRSIARVSRPAFAALRDVELAIDGAVRAAANTIHEPAPLACVIVAAQCCPGFGSRAGSKLRASVRVASLGGGQAARNLDVERREARCRIRRNGLGRVLRHRQPERAGRESKGKGP